MNHSSGQKIIYWWTEFLYNLFVNLKQLHKKDCNNWFFLRVCWIGIFLIYLFLFFNSSSKMACCRRFSLSFLSQITVCLNREEHINCDAYEVTKSRSFGRRYPLSFTHFGDCDTAVWRVYLACIQWLSCVLFFSIQAVCIIYF